MYHHCPILQLRIKTKLAITNNSITQKKTLSTISDSSFNLFSQNYYKILSTIILHPVNALKIVLLINIKSNQISLSKPALILCITCLISVPVDSQNMQNILPITNQLELRSLRKISLYILNQYQSNL